jgi:hypothetical protein
VRFERTGVLKGFMIFLMATGWPVSSSLAELMNHVTQWNDVGNVRQWMLISARSNPSDKILFFDLINSFNAPDETECAHADGLEINIAIERKRKRKRKRKRQRDIRKTAEC